MKKYYYLILVLLYSPEVRASWLSDGMAKTGTMGEVFEIFNEQVSSVGGILQLVSYLIALVFCISGVMKIKDHVDAPGKVPIREPMMRIIVGALFIALPTFIYIIINSTVGTSGSLDLKVDIN